VVARCGRFLTENIPSRLDGEKMRSGNDELVKKMLDRGNMRGPRA
jgi:hypothetical protein